MNYKIIQDEKILRDFIDWLPVLDEKEKYYLCLFARSKYCKQLVHIKSDKAQLKRFVSNKERMFEKIKQLEIEEGCYLQRDVKIPLEALALYITVNPRDMWRASVNTMVKLANAIRDQNILMNPHQEALSEIQKAKSRTCYIDFDFDGDNIPTKDELENIVNKEAITLLRTRGGVHILVDPKKVDSKYKNTFYQKLSKIEGVDQTGDQMIPVPGCSQGDFIPKFIEL